MTEYRYPYGYAGNPQGMGTMLTWAEMLTKDTVKYLHPEFLRRFHALIEFGAQHGIPLGVGTGWRIQPNPPPPGFANPGNSWHESCPVSPKSPTALAIDTVPNISWDWMEAQLYKYGLRSFRNVGNEPWHIQPYEIPTSRNYATHLPPIETFPLPGEPIPPDIPPVTPPVSEVYSVNGYRLDVVKGSSGKMAKMCQQQINLLSGAGIAEDGNFGDQSVAALKNLQAVLHVGVDGKCGPKTWQAMEDGIKSQANAGDWN